MTRGRSLSYSCAQARELALGKAQEVEQTIESAVDDAGTLIAVGKVVVAAGEKLKRKMQARRCVLRTASGRPQSGQWPNPCLRMLGVAREPACVTPSVVDHRPYCLDADLALPTPLPTPWPLEPPPQARAWDANVK